MGKYESQQFVLKTKCVATWDRATKKQIHILHIFPSLPSGIVSFCFLNKIELASTRRKISLQFWFEFFSSFMEMAPWSFQLVRYNLFWPHSLEGTTVTESVVSDENCTECKGKGITEVMNVKFSLPGKE